MLAPGVNPLDHYNLKYITLERGDGATAGAGALRMCVYFTREIYAHSHGARARRVAFTANQVHVTQMTPARGARLTRAARAMPMCIYFKRYDIYTYASCARRDCCVQRAPGPFISLSVIQPPDAALTCSSSLHYLIQ